MEEVSLIGDHGGQQWVTGDSTGWDSSPNFASEADTAGPAPIVEIFHALFKRFPRMNCIDCHTIMNHNDHNHIYISLNIIIVANVASSDLICTLSPRNFLKNI